MSDTTTRRDGVDYSFGRPDIAVLKAAGVTFAVRYLPYGGTNGKYLTAAEAEALHAAGIDVCLVFERSEGRPLTGRTGGVEDGKLAQMGIAQVGAPIGIPVYFAVDFDANPGQQEVIDDYLRGAASVVGPERVGVYGGYWVIKRCAENGSARWLWQTYAWSGGNVHPGLHLYQYRNGVSLGGAEVDLNYAYGGRFGQWPANNDEEGWNMEALERLARVERLLAANGALDGEGTLVQGEDALELADRQGYSAMLAGQEAKASAARAHQRLDRVEQDSGAEMPGNVIREGEPVKLVRA